MNRGIARRLSVLLAASAVRWSDDQCYRFGASLSYYAVFSMFPLLLLCTTAIGFMLGHDVTLRDRLLAYAARSGAAELRPLVADTLTSLQAHAKARGFGAVAGVVTLLFGASGVFSELDATLNAVWRVQAPLTRSLRRLLLDVVVRRALSLLVALPVAALLLLDLALNGLVRSADESSGTSTGGHAGWLVVEAIVSTALLSALLAGLYRVMPRTPVAWRDVLGGALIAAILFTALKYLLGWYLGHIGSYAAYGVVGGLLGLLTWIYVASLIFFFGAEFSHVYAERHGSLVGTGEA